jgi:hypothetical protein
LSAAARSAGSIIFPWLTWGLRPRLYSAARFAGFAPVLFTDYARRYCVVQDVSSITNDVCNDESSTPRK